MVDLVWSGGALPIVTMAVDVPDDPVWLVWISLPFFTVPPFWVRAYRVAPLPTVTAAKKHNTLDDDD